LDSLEKVYIDTLTVGDTLCVKGPSRFEMDMIADSNLSVGDSAYFADDIEINDTLFVSIYGDIQDAIVNNKLTVTDSLEIGIGIDAASAWGHFDSLDTDHIDLGVNLLGSGAYGVLDSLDIDHIDLGVNLLGSGAYADLDSIQSDHYTGTNMTLSAWLELDSLDSREVVAQHAVFDTLDADSTVTLWFDSKEVIATDMWGGASAPAQSITGVSPVWKFDPSTDEEVHAGFYLGESYQDGEDFTISLEWAPTSTDANTVTWGIEYNITPITGTSVIDGATSTSVVTQDASGTRGDLQQTLGWTISGSGVTGDSWVGIRIFRDADASETGADDDYPDDADLVSLTATIPCDKLE
jgi:hypothetical protein